MNQQLRVFVPLLEELYSVLRTHVATNTIWKSRSGSDTLKVNMVLIHECRQNKSPPT